jgi:flagellar biosynthesis/type III secretory pathway protein FliH
VSSSNSGVLRQPFLGTEAQVIGSNDARYVDAHQSKRLDEAQRAGYDQGFADGAKAAEAAARRSADAAAQRLRTASQDAVGALVSTTVQLVPELMDLAIRIARHIVDEVPEQVSASLESRIAAALGQIDDEHLTVYVSPLDAGEVTAGFATNPHLTMEIDESLRPGEARIDGRWAHADLTLETAWSLVEASLHA